MITKTYIPEINPKTAYRKIGNQIVIVHPFEESIITLNETGSSIWQQIEDNRVDIQSIANKLSEQCDVTPEDAIKDVIEFINTMIKKDLIN